MNINDIFLIDIDYMSASYFYIAFLCFLLFEIYEPGISIAYRNRLVKLTFKNASLAFLEESEPRALGELCTGHHDCELTDPNSECRPNATMNGMNNTCECKKDFLQQASECREFDGFLPLLKFN